MKRLHDFTLAIGKKPSIIRDDEGNKLILCFHEDEPVFFSWNLEHPLTNVEVIRCVEENITALRKDLSKLEDWRREACKSPAKTT